VKAILHDIAAHFPAHKVSNESLCREWGGEWTPEKIFSKTGIRNRWVAGNDETALDLAYSACIELIRKERIELQKFDFLILVTQSGDYILPGSAAMLQDRLGLPQSIGTLDVNHGCAGYVYGLSLAKGLIETGQAKNVLLVTSETYSKYIHPLDRSVRSIFGDAATASWIGASVETQDYIGNFQFGADGSGAKNLLVKTGGARFPRTMDSKLEVSDSSGNRRSQDNLFMNGPEIVSFSLREVPRAVKKTLEAANCGMDDVDYFVFHQANSYMLELLRKKCGIPQEKFVVDMEETGNTVSSTIPLAIMGLIRSGNWRDSTTAVLVGFGLGYSWASCVVRCREV
jgi:3-oxoacyl-[acyl-carrier-protein] synthase-3